MIILDKYSGSCNSVDDLSTKICILSKTKDINVKVFNMITNQNEAKTMLKLEETLTLHNVLTHTKSILNKDQNQHYYNTL